MDLCDFCVLRDDGRNDGVLKGACCGDDPIGLNDSGGCFHVEARFVSKSVRFQDIHACAHRGVHHLGIIFDICGNAVFADKSIRGVSKKFQVGKPIVPDRAVGHQIVPSRGAPTFGNAAALKDQMRHRLRAQMFAESNSGLSGSNNKCVDFLYWHKAVRINVSIRLLGLPRWERKVFIRDDYGENSGNLQLKKAQPKLDFVIFGFQIARLQHSVGETAGALGGNR